MLHSSQFMLYTIQFISELYWVNSNRWPLQTRSCSRQTMDLSATTPLCPLRCLACMISCIHARAARSASSCSLCMKEQLRAAPSVGGSSFELLPLYARVWSLPPSRSLKTIIMAIPGIPSDNFELRYSVPGHSRHADWGADCVGG